MRFGTAGRLIAASFLVLAGLGSLTGNAQSPTAAGVDPPADPALVAAAKAEGKVTFYCAVIPKDCEGISTAFQKKYGITVNMLRIVSADMTARFAAEKRANADTADVLLSSDLPFLNSGASSGLLTSYAKAGLLPADYPKEWIAPGIDSPFEFEVLGIGYNTRMVKPQDVPKEWTDLLDPKWKGLMDGPSPAVSPAVPVIYGTIMEFVKDPDFLKKLGRQNIAHLAGGMVAASASLGAGEYAIQAVANTGSLHAEKAKGAPVDIVYPKGATGPPFIWALNAKPQRPNAQKLFAQFVISREGNKALFESNPGSASAYAKPSFPVTTPDFRYFEEEARKRVLSDLGLAK